MKGKTAAILLAPCIDAGLLVCVRRCGRPHPDPGGGRLPGRLGVVKIWMGFTLGEQKAWADRR